MLPLALAAGVSVAVIAVFGFPGVWFLAGLTSAIGLAAATVEHALHQLKQLERSQPNTSITYRAGRLGHSYWAMIIAHLGVAFFVGGVTLVKTFETEKDVVMAPGATESIGPWRITFIGVSDRRGPNFVAAHGVFELTSGEGRNILLLEPEKRRYISGGQVMTEADVDSSLLRDIYVSLGEQVESPKPGQEGAWSVRLYLKPFIVWIWLGCIMMAFGGVLTLFDRRYKRSKAAQTRSSASAQGAA
jgi:cytochrome c-type biogenesis protein CcmF